ncbi:DNA alkylation repair protein [Sanguibacter sp. A247]|uniref:DNA alkylation repair protein n=1 Tax=unclassified Sanguibacter TaxID=2645534 RepID=UPI003FD6F046
MAETMTRDEVLAELAAIGDPKVQAVNARHGDDHTVNLTTLRALAKRVGTRQTALARELWMTGDGDARLLALLVLSPKDLTVDDLDEMLREARTPKQQDWLVGYVVKKSPHVEALRLRWKAAADPWVESAGWALTSDRVPKAADGLDLPGLLDEISVRMKDAPERLQWAMNWCLGTIGIHHPALRERVLAIGERLEVLKDYPTPRGCVSPYVPLWVPEMVARQG